MGAFADACSAWAREAKDRMESVFKTAAEDMAEEVSRNRKEGGKLPYDTGNLRRSLLASTTAMPLQADPTVEWPEGAGYDTSAIMHATLDDTIYIGFQAAYARRLNYGFVGEDALGRRYDQKGAHFVEAAIDQWPEIVKAAAAKVQANDAARKAGKAPP